MPMRLLLPSLLLALLTIGFVWFAPAVEAEEVFVLDKGSVVRGIAITETDEKVVVRLSGFLEENTITLRRSEITRRYLLKDPNASTRTVASDIEAPADAPPLQGRPGVPRTIRLAPDGTARADDDGTLLAEQPAIEDEGFFERLGRRARLALPDALEGRLLVGALLLIVLATLVAGGARMLGMKAVSLQASTTLGVLIGLFLLADILFHGEVLRADRAIWILPLQAAIWLGVARSSLEAPLARAIPLFAFVLFGSTCFVFATGTLLVSV